MLGTPAYMAPEQAPGEIERLDRRTDVFGLGSILCEILTGRPAFTGDSTIDILRKARRRRRASYSGWAIRPRSSPSSRSSRASRSSLEPGKVYVVEFWATWCGPCRVTIPHLTELQKKHVDVVFIGVSVCEQDQDAVKPYVEAMGDQMAYRVAMDLDPREGGWQRRHHGHDVDAAARQGGIPIAFIIDKDGRIAWIGHPISLWKRSTTPDATETKPSPPGPGR